MARIWLDPLTPKQALFCSKIGELFEDEGFELVYTTREYSEATGRLELLGISAQVIGKHGGTDVYQKLLASAERVVALTKYINKVKPDIAFSFASPEGARVAYGLDIPYFTANDSPHSRFVAQLTIPYAISLLTPWIMKGAWSKLGVPKEKIVPYHGLDPVAWLQEFTPDTQVLTKLGLSTDSEFVVIRPEEAQASYLNGRAVEVESVTDPVIYGIQEAYPELKLVVLCRYSAQRKTMRNRFNETIILPDKVVDAPSLLASAQLLVGAGGTMNQEASLLGIPVISCFPGDHLITDQYLAKEQLLYRLIEPAEATSKALEILDNREKYQTEHRRRAQKILSQMENPAEVIFSNILAYYNEKMKKG